MGTNSVTEQNGRGGAGSYANASFQPMSYDAEVIEPDAYPGEYEASVDSVKFQLTKKTNKPMIHIEWKLTGTNDESDDCQKSIGSKVSDWIVLANDKTGNRGKVSLRTLRDQLGLDPDVIPTTISSFDDLKDLGEALKGQSMSVWVTTSTDPDGNVRTNIAYAAPKGAGAMAPLGDEEVEVEEEAPKAPARGKAQAKPAAKGGTSKRR
jgi:hypothetical protein